MYFFSFTLFFGKNKINKVECIFINYEQLNIFAINVQKKLLKIIINLKVL